MRHRKRPLTFLVISIICLVALALLIYFLSPEKALFPQLPLLTTLPVFFALVFFAFFSLGNFIFKNKAHGILIAVFVTTSLLFLQHDLRHPFFFVLLFALFLTLELFVSYRK